MSKIIAYKWHQKRSVTSGEPLTQENQIVQHLLVFSEIALNKLTDDMSWLPNAQTEQFSAARWLIEETVLLNNTWVGLGLEQ